VPTSVAANEAILSDAENLIRTNFSSLDLPFRQTDLELLGIVAGIEEEASRLANDHGK
jgi:hypothetical protein